MKTDKFITCECHGHGLYMDYFIGQDKRHPSELYLTPYGNATYFENKGMRWRLKKAWRMIRKGTMSGGEVVLSEDNAASLKAYIGDFLIKAER